MPNHIETLLTTIGVPAEDAAKIIALPEADQAAFDVKPYADKVKTNYQTQLQNDPTFFSEITIEKLPAEIKKTMESGQYARATNVTKEKIAKALGFSSEEIKDLQADEFKALDYYIPAIIDKWTKTKAGDKETQQQLIEERKKNEQYQGLEEKLRTQFETESNQKINSTIFRANLIGELSAIPGLKIPAADIAKAAEDILTGKYAFERVGDFSVELRQKTNPQMKVLKDNSSHELTLREALQQIAKDRGWAAAETQDDGKGSGKVKIEPGKDGKLNMVIPAHLQSKIGNHIATGG